MAIFLKLAVTKNIIPIKLANMLMFWSGITDTMLNHYSSDIRNWNLGDSIPISCFQRLAYFVDILLKKDGFYKTIQVLESLDFWH